MKEMLKKFAMDYAIAEDKLNGREDDQSSIHYPAVFVFIGDKVSEAIAPIMDIHDKKWDNSAGVMYIHIASEKDDPQVPQVHSSEGYSSPHPVSQSSVPTNNGAKGMDQVTHARLLRFELPHPTDATANSTANADAKDGVKKTRKELYTRFYEDNRHLIELNRILRKVSHNIADFGRMYSSFDRIHLSFITRVDDPLNVFIPEISLLSQSIFNQSFKSVQMDLYGLISEKEVETFGYSYSVGVAFLRELEHMQQSDYTFTANLHVTEDGISMPVVHSPSPLFELVYLLSDRNERGISSFDEMQDNYEIICHINLLKNRKQKDMQHQSSNRLYNNMSFKSNIKSDSGREGFVSAGFSRVKRPNQSIALTVLYHFYKQMVLRMKNGVQLNNKEKLAFFGIDPLELSQRVKSMMPDDGKIEEMTGIMMHQMSFNSLKRMSLLEAEHALYGEGCETYFRNNYTREIQAHNDQIGIGNEMALRVKKQMLDYPQIGFFQVAAWSADLDQSGSIVSDLRASIRDKVKELESAKAELGLCYQGIVEEQSFPRIPLMDKHNLRSFIRYLVDTVYRRKVYILQLETELRLYQRVEDELGRIHQHYKRQVEQMERLEGTLYTVAVESITTADDYIGQNILEYYDKVTEKVVRDIENKRGAAVFFEDRYLGNVTQLLEAGIEHWVSKLTQICRNNILTAEPFAQTFEEELLRRANVTIDYNNKQVLTKDDLFKKLYRTLEEHAAINLRLLDYTQEHRYEEKYFFGDSESEFIRYSLGADETSRIYKLGYVHEKRSSGVEKLNLMGGFHIEDLMYYRNGKLYYETYLQNGYEFHGLDPNILPELR
ncbi:transcription initiation factor TFIID [Paenibacillus crassostreae]|uniref:Transcription initiation factor TFIID n=1 Tax=Paenibacillus crassostreae TaxID=1763538 RepID=A0A167BWS4_9BACL|nr:transcription initiation factor TFIID [Paenibacillus crassostreae]AOZ92582.1 transcription initiation factor TFIID [Paenibacillus crassostreae]OAB72531.1 transcription initiation factor TFIID [Paenibacillus crassostreae]